MMKKQLLILAIVLPTILTACADRCPTPPDPKKEAGVRTPPGIHDHIDSKKNFEQFSQKEQFRRRR